MRRLLVSGILVLLVGTGASWRGWNGEAVSSTAEQPAEARDDTLEAYKEPIPGTVVEFEMVPVPAGSVTINNAEKSVGPFWMAATEVRWEAYDAYRLDEQMDDLTDAEADAISLPSKPYGFGNKIPGFGREGYPALAVTQHAARKYARWLSAKTGHTYRLPSAAEWKHACRIGHGAPQEWTDDELKEHAWYRSSAEGEAQPVASLKPSDLGIYDQLGNAAEHVRSKGEEDNSPPEVWGGSYRSEAGALHCTARLQKTSDWQESDPQLPKSKWWLSDAPFVGFRLVRSP